MFKKNVGTLDSRIRLVVGVIVLSAGLLVLGAAQGSTFGLVAVVFGVLVLLTGATRRCPNYVWLGDFHTLNDRFEKYVPSHAAHA